MTEDIRSRIGLRPVINVSGTMTSLGASIVVPEAVQAMADILPQFVEINDLQRKASAIIARRFTKNSQAAYCPRRLHTGTMAPTGSTSPRRSNRCSRTIPTRPRSA